MTRLKLVFLFLIFLVVSVLIDSGIDSTTKHQLAKHKEESCNIAYCEFKD